MMFMRWVRMGSHLLLMIAIGCGGEGSIEEGDAAPTDASLEDAASADAGPSEIPNPLTNPSEGPPAGNPDGRCDVPAEAGLEDVSSPRSVVGSGTPESCSAEAFVAAVARGGVITFDCGPDPITIKLTKPAKIVNSTGPKIVIDGAGKITLDGGDATRILYMNTCDQAQGWTTSHCQDQDHPQLTVQNLTFTRGSAKNEKEFDGGGAIWVRGGRFKIINSRFFGNTCASVGADVGGGAVRVLSQFQGRPVYVVNSTFGAPGPYANSGSNGGALSSIGVSWTILNSVLAANRAVGKGGNPAMANSPGGGSGGAIYNDGNKMTLSICGTRIEQNEVTQHGSAIFFVSNDHSGDIRIRDSVITANRGGSWYPTYPQISNHDDTPIMVTNSTIK